MREQINSLTAAPLQERKSKGRIGESQTRTILVTGGAGFVGCNLTERLLAEPETRVRVFDNLSRSGVEHNLAWLQTLPGRSRLEFVEGDVRDAASLIDVARDADEIYHLAAQVAVTTSIDEPRGDFDVNVLGTFNVLEAARRSGRHPFLLFTSTNKVYGSLYGVPVVIDRTRYRARNPNFIGVSEGEPLDFHSPYGCSKGAADQYVRDYARIYKLPTVVFRMSCIAGPHQFGNEDQGWVAHFLYSVLEGKPITIYGDGFQVRDVLHVSDLVNAMQAAYRRSEQTAGNIYNLGGGMARAMSVIEMLDEIAQETGVKPKLQYQPIRPGDQPLYVSDTTRFERDTDWKPRFSCEEILRSIHGFWKSNRKLLTRERGVRHPQYVREMVAEEVA